MKHNLISHNMWQSTRITAARIYLVREYKKKFNITKVHKRNFHQILHGGGGGGGDPFLWSLFITGTLMFINFYK